jgi:CRP-like cAMP-binding protein
MSDHGWLVRKLTSRGALLEGDPLAISQLPMTVRSANANADLARQGHRTVECCVLLAGLACRYRVYKAGQRQIMSFHAAGDLLDLDAFYLGVTDYSVAALTPVRVGFIPHAALRDLAGRRQSIGEALCRDALSDSAVFREWLANVGRRSARERVAHLICEVYARALAVDLAKPHECEFPITQAEMADALGLSTVHVNRVLQELRGDGLLTLSAKRVKIHDWEGFKHVADFDPAYLHLSRQIADVL